MPTAAQSTVNSKVIGIQAGKAKFGLPPMFTGQSLVKTQVMKVTAVVVPIIPKRNPAVWMLVSLSPIALSNP